LLHKGFKWSFGKSILIGMKIVGTIYGKEEAVVIQAIAKCSIVAQRARYLAKNMK
jgi:hypothetical protein